jgi:cyclohexyl-isocyanide hydratase
MDYGNREGQDMRAAFVLFDELTTLDFVGVYDPVTRLRSMDLLPDFQWDICGLSDEVTDDRGLCIKTGVVGRPLADYDLLVVPGGKGTRQLRFDPAFIAWLRSADRVPLKASVCTGSLLLGAAGFLRGLRATTHPSAFELLAEYCDVDRGARVLDAGAVITSRGVTAGIDLGLHLVSRLAGADSARRMAAQMDYPYFALRPEETD